MQTTYGGTHRKPTQKGRGRKKGQDGHQLVQLLMCLAVFLAVFIGKGVWPSKVAQTGEQLLHVIRANTDFRTAFARLGQSLTEQESVLGDIGDFCVSVFAPVQPEKSQLSSVAATAPEQDLPDISKAEPEKSDAEIIVRQEPALQVGDVVQVAAQPESDLPEDYDARWLFLGEMETATPVMGTVTSAFGYREHPTMGRHAVHGGVDIAADKGTEVSAFTGGTVASVGHSDDFGLYLQIDHPNGLSTFYSHCERICVQKGDAVTVGQTVAQVGSTGQSTGPHLHFEVRLNGVRLNPMHYIDPVQET